MASTDAELNAHQRDIAARLAEIGFVLPGSITERTMRCGKQRCACATDPDQRHGPYILWTRAVNGKTVTKKLSPDQLERYQAWFDNRRQLRQLTSELEALSLQAITTTEGWGS